jgi:hypothetical protein
MADPTTALTFCTKDKAIDWERIKAIDVGAVEAGKAGVTLRELEALYDTLVAARARTPEDDTRTTTDYRQLFRVT